MKIDEHIVIRKPPGIQAANGRRDAAWTRRAILHAIWVMRRKVMEEQRADLFQVYEMTDCIEVHIEGEFVTLPTDKDSVRRKKRRALKAR